jgi:hypothetical protein
MLKYQALITPDGLVADFFGPIEGRRNDAHMLRESKLIDTLRDSFSDLICYGDPAYPILEFLMCPFERHGISERQRAFNKAISRARITVEWIFGILTNTFPGADYKRRNAIFKTPVASWVMVAVYLLNIRTCLQGANAVSRYFNCNPPTVEEYMA